MDELFSTRVRKPFFAPAEYPCFVTEGVYGKGLRDLALIYRFAGSSDDVDKYPNLLLIIRKNH